MTTAPSSLDTFDLGDLALQSGEVLRSARLVYATFGAPSARRDNTVLFPTYYTGSHADNARLIGPGRALDPSRWFVVVPNLLGNGVSSSPSHDGPQRGADFPHVTVHDNVVFQQRLLSERLGIDRVALAVGWSMGALQAYHFAALFPDRTRALLAVCGSARTSRHNWVFLEGVKAALLADPDFRGGRYDSPPQRGLEAFGRVYAGWAYSQAFFRKGLYERLGFASAADLLDAWARDHVKWDANDLLAMLWTWQHADLSDNDVYRGDYARALGAIEARTIVMPCLTDLYFSPEDSAIEVGHMKSAELRPIDSDWGHVSGGPDRSPADTAFVELAMRDLLG
ncbi:MAG TPA: alpha/beta fold hydrolase [Polyangiaceae bacterium]|nr:alpha/beta fold hydrolase [Polyangiaceae bacterium]